MSADGHSSAPPSWVADVTETLSSGGSAASTTVRDEVLEATARLSAAGCDTPRLDAELLVADAMGVDRGRLWLGAEAAVNDDMASAVAERIERREQREPVAYITGSKGFRRIDLVVDRRVLIPRPETEMIVDVVLELPQRARLHDVGTGSGAVALAAKQERPDLAVSGSDLSPDAVAVAVENAQRLGLEVSFSVERDLPPGSYDLVTANLPYIRDDEWSSLAPEMTRYEPSSSFMAGSDGLDAIRGFVAGVPPGVRVVLEHTPAQAETVRGMLAEASSLRWLDGREWVTVGTAPPRAW